MRKHKGFTIIEVVLVLAIAGLIFLMVFIALPTLQRSQRDTQRKRDIDRLYDATNRWLANNRGKSLANSEFVGGMNALRDNGYLGRASEFKDPDGQLYTVGWGEVGVVPINRKNSTGSHTMIYRFANAQCDGENTVHKSGANSFAISIVLEGGGVYCVSNS